MKRLLLLTMAFAVSYCSFAQNDYKKPSAIGIHFSMYDFKTAAAVRNTSLADVIRNKKIAKIKEMDAAFGLSYWRGLTNHIDFAAALSGGFTRYPVPNKPSFFNQHLLLDLTTTVNIKLLSDKYFFVPYLTGGIGVSSYQGYFAAFAPVGLGLQFKLSPTVFVMANTTYRLPVTENAAYHFFNSIGIVQSFPRAKVIPAPMVEIPVILDRDGDGVFDGDDKCPDVAGVVALMGCPDRDGDGITDADDKCPDVAGLAKYQGCPIPDTDGDGINDETDKCPTVKGFARYQGCPIPDTDGDGVNDEEDKCPTRVGPASNQGCPVIAKEVIEKVQFAAKNVFFATGSFKLLPKSFKSLDEVVRLMKADETLMIDIDGQTDAQGSDESNQVLSDNRAGSVKNYIVSKGVSETRLVSAGYGETKPVEDNTTAAGRAKNRRTEMTVRNF